MPIRDQQKVRRAAAAGRFYEGDALSLRRRMAETEAGLPPEVPAGKTVRGCVLPHAGYMFSLGVAMETLRAARHCGCSKVVLLGPSHYVGFRGIAAATFTSWRTPFGDLSTATDLLDVLEAERNPLVTVNDDAHINEHSLEVQFPLIQYFFDAPVVLPLVVGGISAEDAQSLGAALAKLDAPDVLWLISSDFTHYGRKFRYTPFGESADPAELNRLDREAAELIAARDLTGFVKFLGRTGATICGAHPIAIYLAMLDRLDPERTVRGRVAAMADSGAVSGDYRTVVDYAGIVFEKA
ncbi:MAG: AmmeMemoRadiSam system protein B [Victivallis vadensis]